MKKYCYFSLSVFAPYFFNVIPIRLSSESSKHERFPVVYFEASHIHKQIWRCGNTCHGGVLYALGPTATVLAYDLAKAGVQALDVGHINIEYEWFRMKATLKVPVPWRYENEAGSTFLKMSSDPEYTSQVITQIGLS